MVSVKFILALPATEATKEGSLSMLRLIKSYLRSAVGQILLNQLILLSTCKEKQGNLNLQELSFGHVV